MLHIFTYVRRQLNGIRDAVVALMKKHRHHVRHHAHHAVFVITAIVISVVVYNNYAFAATYNFTQSSWVGGADAVSVASHTSNQSNWTKYATSTGVTAGATIALTPTTYSFTDDGATSTSPQASVSGGGFSNGALSSTAITGTGTSSSVLLQDTSLPPGVKEITAGYAQTCALKADGSVMCWGQNLYGQLGDTTTVDKSIPTQVSGLTAGTVKEITGGDYHTCALKTDGSMVCWGYNALGQLGDNTLTQRNIPTQVSGLTAGTVKEITAGSNHTCALKTDGSMMCWGYNVSGQLGDATTVSKSIPTQVSGLTAGTVKEITARYNHACAIKTDGSAVCWGANGNLQLGDATATDKSIPTQVSGLTAGTVKEIEAGNFHSCALKTDGSVMCWGTNGNGQLGDATLVNKSTPTQVSGLTAGTVKEITAGQGHTCAIKTDGSVMCWGYNATGGLGDATLVDKSIPTQVSGLTASTVKEITAGNFHTCALKTDDSVMCWGQNTNGQLGDGTTVNKSIPTQVSGLVAGGGQDEIAGGGSYSCVLKSDGSVMCWGYNAYGQLGDTTLVNKSIPTQVSGLTAGTVREIVTGSFHTCAIKTDGSAMCWGYNAFKELGDGTTVAKSIPTQVSGLTAGTAREIATGDNHTCVLKTDGSVVCWGNNSYGQLGDATTVNKSIPTQVSGLTAGTVKEITAGNNFSCALKTNGSTVCWGYNSYGNLGDATIAAKSIPTQVSGLTAGTVKEIEAGDDHTCALKTDGSAVCWGRNAYNQLGNTSVGSQSTTPAQVSGLTAGTVEEIAAGGVRTCALKSDGSAMCWGNIPGNNTANQVNIPTQVSGLTAGTVKDITAGYDHSCAIKSDGSVVCWAANGSGQLGDNTLTQRLVPTQTSGLVAGGGSLYASSGTFTSATINMGSGSAWSSLTWSATLNAQTITVKARSSATSDFSGATAFASCTAITSGAALSTGGCVTTGHRYIQYQATLSTGNSAVTPTLDSLTIGYTQYTSGTLISSVYDSESDGNLVTNMQWMGTGTSTTETIKFQVRSSNSTSTLESAPWCGTGTTCDGTTYFTDPLGGVTLSASHPLRSGGNDRFFQYKVLLSSGGAFTPTLTSALVQYVVNAPPEFDATYGTNGTDVSQVATSTDSNYGKVLITYKIRDIDTTTGTTNPGFISPSFEYNIGGGWVTINSADLSPNDTANKAVDGTAYTTYTAIWSATSTLPNTFASTTRVRVTINDNEGANNTATAISAFFVVDTRNPTLAAVFDSSTGDTSSTITLSTADDSTSQYRICNDAAFPDLDAQGNTCTWSSLAANLASSSIPFTPVGSPSTEVAYLEVRDLYGNVTARTLVAPAALSDFAFVDISNMTGGTYQEFINWSVFVATSSATFSSYKLYHSLDGTNYSLLATITDSTLNYYRHNVTTATTSTQYYKMLVTTTQGGVSNYTAAVSDIPDGYGGQVAAPTDTTPPVISNIAVPALTVKNNQATVTFVTDKLAKGTVQYKKAVDASWTTVASASYVTSQSITLTSLMPDTLYNVQVKAMDILDNVSDYSAGPDFTTNSGPVITAVTSTSITDVSATIQWNTSTSSDSYIYYSTSPSLASPILLGTATLVACSAPSTCPHSVAMSALVAGDTYYFYVKSTDADGNVTTNDNNGSYYSFSTTIDTTAPVISDISNPVISSSASVIVWQTDEPATTQVQWGTASGQLTHTTVLDSTKSIYHVVSLSADTNDTNSTAQTLLPSTPYFFKVFSNDLAGNQASSTEQTFSTNTDGEVTIVTRYVGGGGGGGSPAVPEVKADTTSPSILLAETSDVGAFNASVKVSTDEDVHAFVYYGETMDYGNNVGNSDWSASKTISLKKLQTGTTYHYMVKTFDRAGNVAESPDSTFTTLFVSELSSDRSFLDKASDLQGRIEALIESALPSLSPPFVSKPEISNITESSATITWKTNVRTFGSLHYATAEEYTATSTYPLTVSAGQDKASSHTVELTNLMPNTMYHIQATSHVFPQVVGKTPDMTFTTRAAKIQASIVEKKNDSFTVAWTTDQPTTSIVEYKNLKSGETNRMSDDTKKTFHSVKIDHVPSATSFTVKVSGVNAVGNTVEAASSISVTTSSDVTAPKISNFKVDNALVPGRNDRIQTVVGWQTDELANSTVYYEEGVGASGTTTRELANKVESLDNYLTNHIMILANLKPGTVYRIKIVSSDSSGNEKTFGPNTIITPRQTESVMDIIFKNFEDTFKFLRTPGN